MSEPEEVSVIILLTLFCCGYDPFFPYRMIERETHVLSYELGPEQFPLAITEVKDEHMNTCR